MKKVTSKQCPPGKTHIILTMQRRNGERIEYHTGEYRKESEMKRELGGCAFCLSMTWCTVNGVTRMGASHPHFHRFTDYHCPKCKPAIDRLSEIEGEMIRLAYEKEELMAYKKAKK